MGVEKRGRLMLKGARLEGGKGGIWRMNRCFDYSGFVYTLHHQVLVHSRDVVGGPIILR